MGGGGERWGWGEFTKRGEGGALEVCSHKLGYLQTWNFSVPSTLLFWLLHTLCQKGVYIHTHTCTHARTHSHTQREEKEKEIFKMKRRLKMKENLNKEALSV